jgi:ATP-dependent RNA helicase DeaD
MTKIDQVVPALATALATRGYEVLTPVQEAVLEHGEADLLVSAQTGSGKTVAFGMAIAPTLLGNEPRLPRGGAPLALVIAPTRELALQVARELKWLFAEAGANIATCVGGMDTRTERRNLQRGAHIVVGTPGRLRDHIERGSFNTQALKAVVLDEADEMLDLGFREDLEYILDATPQERRTLMFSATVPRSIANLAKRYQRDAARISTKGEEKQHLDIEYRALTIAPNDRENAIVNMLRYYEADNALVFCATRATVNHMFSRFANRGFAVVALSGELSQKERSHALQAMRDGRAKVCIATDVAARGIDLPNLDLVIHAELPKNKESLLHRSGRTGRAGRKGVSALIVPFNAKKRTERLLQSAKITATWASPPTADDVIERDRERLLEDAVLLEPIREDEKAMAGVLLERHGAEQVAAAFLRQHATGRSAPEELIASMPEPEKKNRQENFKDGTWFSLNAGHDQKVEPRWLVPMLCRAGHIIGHDIGRIRIHTSETHVEISGAAKGRFEKIVAEGGQLEEGMKMQALEGNPETPRNPSRKPAKRKQDSPNEDTQEEEQRPKPGKNSRGKPHGLKKEREAEKVAKAINLKERMREKEKQGGQTDTSWSPGLAKPAAESRDSEKRTSKTGDKTRGKTEGKKRAGKPAPGGPAKKRKPKRPDKNKGARRVPKTR